MISKNVSVNMVHVNADEEVISELFKNEKYHFEKLKNIDHQSLNTYDAVGNIVDNNDADNVLHVVRANEYFVRVGEVTWNHSTAPYELINLGLMN